MRTNIYVDGFNLYYGALKGTGYKWLDIEAMCVAALDPQHKIQRIRYFTALVTPFPHNPDQHIRQQTYIRALKASTTADLSVKYGSFLTHQKKRRLANGQGSVVVLESSEKGSDVNLGSHLLLDAFKKDFDAAVVVSNDSDLAEPIRIVRQELGIDIVGVLNPHSRNGKPAVTLKQVAKFQLPIQHLHIAGSQMLSPITDKDGHIITKPTRW